ncbi:hypothetical protein Tco_0832885 [Tanacetum coccineum]
METVMGTKEEMVMGTTNRNGGGNSDGNNNGNGNRNGNWNGGGNSHGNHNVNFGERVVGLTRLFEKMERVFHISNCPQKSQVKYATCTLLNSALTWWNSRKRTIRIDAAYAMGWTELMKLMTEGNVIAAEPTRLQDMDQKLKGYARSAENKRRLDNNPRDNHG